MHYLGEVHIRESAFIHPFSGAGHCKKMRVAALRDHEEKGEEEAERFSKFINLVYWSLCRLYKICRARGLSFRFLEMRGF